MKKLLICILLLPLVSSVFQVSPARSAGAVVRAILFYSPTCGHCHFVMTEVFPPLIEKYGDQLQIVELDVSLPAEQELFMAALDYFKVEYPGVPFLVIGDQYLVGSQDIPEQLPGLIEKYLAQGGVDWSPVPGLAEAMNAAYPSGETTQAGATPASISATGAGLPDPTLQKADSLGARFSQDPVGNSLAVVVLVGMLFVLGASFMNFRSTIKRGVLNKTHSSTSRWWIPGLCVAGLGVAGYLAFVEMTRVQAVCGPVGDCNTVQQSEYAMLFGFLPIGLLGIFGYVLILIAWGVSQKAERRLAAYASLAQLGMTAFGVLFSIYLTFLEPFVIGATCAWCLTSAVIMTALLWLSLAPAGAAFSFLFRREKRAYKKAIARRTS